MPTNASIAQLNDVDRRIWTEELDAFVPRRIFDIHTHMYRWEFNLNPEKETDPDAELFKPAFRVAGRAELDAWDSALLPGREVHRLCFGFPWPACDFDASNRFAAAQAAHDPAAGALMLVRPTMPQQHLEEQFRSQGFLGLKPYRVYATSGNWDTCGITDFLPEEQIELAHRHGSIIMLHLSKRDAIADESNIEDLLRLTSKYNNAKWILAHCGRSYSAWAVERAAKRLRGLPNVWFDVSSVCESDAISAIFSCFGPERVMYGSDDLPIGALRGKYITFGYAWAFISEDNHSLELSHCNRQMTFVRYEQLRAMRRAAIGQKLSSTQIEDLFFNTAFQLVKSVRDKQREAPSADIIRQDPRHGRNKIPSPLSHTKVEKV